VSARDLLVRRRGYVASAWVLTIVAMPAVIVVASTWRDSVEVATVLLLTLTVVLLIAGIGGKLVGAVAAVIASQLVNWFFVVPLHTLSIEQPEHLVALVVFVAVAVAVGALVDTVGHRAAEAQTARSEAEALARGAASLASDREPLSRLVQHVRSSFGLDAVRVLRKEDDGFVTVAQDGAAEGEPRVVLPVSTPMESSAHALELFGAQPTADELRVLRALADQVAVALHAERMAADAAASALLIEIDATRTALLRAVSHDLRTPLASIKAMISGLRDPSVSWSPEQLAEALATVEEETDRLNRVVGNLLDASRLQIGAMAVDLQHVQLADVIAAALEDVNVRTHDVEVSVSAEAPPVIADPILLERSLVNVLSNAVRHNPAGSPVRIEVVVLVRTAQLRVVDHGPGIPSSARSTVLAPFQRLGDQRSGDGVGLGLSITQGFVEAMKGTLSLDDTPGGGLTVTIELPR
jgi:two-component system sensor histidine kinase KdpD